MKKFEYLLIEQSKYSQETLLDIQDKMDATGDEGWELCAIDWGCLIFKREIIK